jgi:hypothetical protein
MEPDRFSGATEALSSRGLDDSKSLTATELSLEALSRTSSVDQLDVRRFEKALEAFCSDTRSEFNRRFPGIGYDSDVWDFRGTTEVGGKRVSLQILHDTKMTRICPSLVANDLAGLHASFRQCARAVLAHNAMQNASKLLFDLEHGLRLFKHLQPLPGSGELSRPLWTLSLDDLRGLEGFVVGTVRVQGLSAEAQRTRLHSLYAAVELLQSRDVVTRMNARMSVKAKDELGQLLKQQAEEFKKNKSAELEPSIGALSDAIVAMVDDNPALSMAQKGVLCVMGLEMCAPSRVNEMLTLSTTDRLASVDAYEELPQLEEGCKATSASAAALRLRRDLHRAHAEIASSTELLLTMKGSKGAAWGPKPILQFMMDMFNECFDRLTLYGQRSRMLVQHYESQPDVLYLPPSLEHLRGKALDRWQLGRVMLLSSEASEYEASIASQHVIAVFTEAKKTFRRGEVVGVDLLEEQTRTLSRNSKTRSDVLYVRWCDIEAELLRRVHEQMESVRWVTATVRYEGRLSNMLVLNDGISMTPPFLPGALTGKYISKCLKPTKSGDRQPQKTVFDVLGITMPVRIVEANESRDTPPKYKDVAAYVSSHDPRRWLTTQALRLAGSQISNVVLNKWANRKDASQVEAYDYSTLEEKARRSAAPLPDGLKEFESLSAALVEVSSGTSALSGEYGLSTRLLTSGTRTVEVTTLSEVREAVEKRPVARAGGKVIILYPTQFGVCLHQHHERACTAYNGCGTACNEQIFVKGDLPSNSAARKQAKHLQAIVVAQIRPLILAHARGAAHDLEALEAHVLGLIKPHMSVEEIANRLIAEFHEYKHLVKDAAFRSKLEDAHVFKGVSDLLDSSDISSGAIIKYNNPSRHGSPELERSVEALGGREAIAQAIRSIEERSPWFAPSSTNEEVPGHLFQVDGEAANDEESFVDEHGESDEEYKNDR